MKRNKKRLVALLITLSALASLAAVGNYALHALGRSELYKAAQENGYCRSENCAEGVATLMQMLAEGTGISSERIPWCMAANAIHSSDLKQLDALKEKFVNLMYRDCGSDEITLDDANFSIGEPDH